MAESKKNYVVDASVILKWFMLEDQSSEALNILQELLDGDAEISVPNHCFTEVMNVLSLKMPKEAVANLSKLLMLNLQEHRLDLEVAALATDITDKAEKVSFYDAAYHALAMKIAGEFVTADAKYFAKTKDLGNVRLLRL